MKTIVGIFSSYQKAKEAVSLLIACEIPAKNLRLLTPQASLQQVGSVPTTAGEQPGMGAALGGVAGSAVGLAGGIVGTSLVLPGVGPILAFGATLLGGLTGAAAGAAAGGALETALQEEMIRLRFEREEAESLDAAREHWWLGLRDAEEQASDTIEDSFETIEKTYRRGFEAALDPRLRGNSYAQAREILGELYPGVCLEEPFRRGYDRGQAYYQALQDQQQGS